MRSLYSILKSLYSMVKNKSLICKQIVKPILTNVRDTSVIFGSQLCSEAKIRRFALNEDRYIRLQTLQDETQKPFIKDQERTLVTGLYNKATTHKKQLSYSTLEIFTNALHHRYVRFVQLMKEVRFLYVFLRKISKRNYDKVQYELHLYP